MISLYDQSKLCIHLNLVSTISYEFSLQHKKKRLLRAALGFSIHVWSEQQTYQTHHIREVCYTEF